MCAAKTMNSLYEIDPREAVSASSSAYELSLTSSADEPPLRDKTLVAVSAQTSAESVLQPRDVNAASAASSPQQCSLAATGTPPAGRGKRVTFSASALQPTRRIDTSPRARRASLYDSVSGDNSHRLLGSAATGAAATGTTAAGRLPAFAGRALRSRAAAPTLLFIPDDYRGGPVAVLTPSRRGGGRSGGDNSGAALAAATVLPAALTPLAGVGTPPSRRRGAERPESYAALVQRQAQQQRPLFTYYSALHRRLGVHPRDATYVPVRTESESFAARGIPLQSTQ